jgi:hypothetical protein
MPGVMLTAVSSSMLVFPPSATCGIFSSYVSVVSYCESGIFHGLLVLCYEGTFDFHAFALAPVIVGFRRVLKDEH